MTPILTQGETAIPLLDAIDIQDKEITVDVLLTQREIADYLVRPRNANYHFTVKNNPPGLFKTCCTENATTHGQRSPGI